MEVVTPTTLIFRNAISTNSRLYSYITQTGVLTFKKPGNYLISLQASFSEVEVGTQLLIGIISVPDSDYLGRASHYVSLAPPNPDIGEIMSCVSVVIVPKEGYQVRLVADPNKKATILAIEKGGTGSGNVTNVSIYKI